MVALRYVLSTCFASVHGLSFVYPFGHRKKDSRLRLPPASDVASEATEPSEAWVVGRREWATIRDSLSAAYPAAAFQQAAAGVIPPQWGDYAVSRAEFQQASVDQLPASQPPANQPATNQPPASQTPAGQPPASQPPAGLLSANQPPASQPPASQLPAGEMQPGQPPASQTPASQPPAGEPPASQLPATQPSPNTEAHAVADGAGAEPSVVAVLEAQRAAAQEQHALVCGAAVEGIADSDKGAACNAHHFCSYHEGAQEADCIRRCSWDAELRVCLSTETDPEEGFWPQLAAADADSFKHWQDCSGAQRSLTDQPRGPRCIASNIVFVRIPKCGSTSFGSVVRRIGSQYGLNGTHGDVPLELSEPQVWSGLHKTRMELEELAQPAFRAKPTLWVTLVRHPVAKALSQYYFYASTHKNFDPSDETMKEFLLSGMHHEDILEKAGHKPRALLTQYDFLVPPGRDRIEDILAAYDVIGTAERFDESVLLLRHKMNLSVCDVSYLVSKNSTTDQHLEKHVPYAQQPPAMKAFLDSAEYRAHLGHDIELHEAVAKHMDEAIAKIGRDKIDEDLRQLRGIREAAAERCPWSDAALPNNHICLWHDQGCQYRCLNRMCQDLAAGASLNEVLEQSKLSTGAARAEATAVVAFKRLDAMKAEQEAAKLVEFWKGKVQKAWDKSKEDVLEVGNARERGNATAVVQAEAQVAHLQEKAANATKEVQRAAEVLKEAQRRSAEVQKEGEVLAQESAREKEEYQGTKAASNEDAILDWPIPEAMKDEDEAKDQSEEREGMQDAMEQGMKDSEVEVENMKIKAQQAMEEDWQENWQES